jgi:hypothetical protein
MPLRRCLTRTWFRVFLLEGPGGQFLVEGSRWLDDPANPHKMPDGLGGLNSMRYL